MRFVAVFDNIINSSAQRLLLAELVTMAVAGLQSDSTTVNFLLLRILAGKLPEISAVESG